MTAVTLTATIPPVPPVNPPQLGIEFDFPPPKPQYWLGLEVWAGDDKSDFQGIITGVKLVNDAWFYLVRDGALECWSPEDSMIPIGAQFPILYRGFRLELFPTPDPLSPLDPYKKVECFRYELMEVKSGRAIAGPVVGYGVVDAMYLAKLDVDNRLQGSKVG